MARGSGYAGLDSTRPKQRQEGDIANMGGTAPGGTVAFMGAVGRSGDVDPVTAAKMQHYGLKDEAPSAKGDAPIHPGLRPGLFRTARDANYQAPDGQVNDPTANDGHPSSPSTGYHRGESPEILKQPRGGYKP